MYCQYEGVCTVIYNMLNLICNAEHFRDIFSILTRYNCQAMTGIYLYKFAAVQRVKGWGAAVHTQMGGAPSRN